MKQDSKAPSFAVSPVAPTSQRTEANPIPQIGMMGGFRLARFIAPALIISVKQKEFISTTPDGLPKKCSKPILTVVYWSEEVSGYFGHKHDVEVGKEKGQWWHSVDELETQVAIDRELRAEKVPS